MTDRFLANHEEVVARYEEFEARQTAMTEDDLIAALGEAKEVAERQSASCAVCVTLPKLSDRVRPAIESALAGKIGEKTLSKILTGAGYNVGARAINYHRSGHTKRRA